MALEYAGLAGCELSGICGIAGTPCLVPQSNFGAPTGTSGPRITQLALRFNF